MCACVVYVCVGGAGDVCVWGGGGPVCEGGGPGGPDPVHFCACR